MARDVLADDDLVKPLLKARDKARGVCDTWGLWYLDLNDLGAALGASNNATLRSHGEAIQRGIDTAVIGAYGNERYNWTGGLTIMFDTDGSSASELDLYNEGAGATWSRDTAWGELLAYLARR